MWAAALTPFSGLALWQGTPKVSSTISARPRWESFRFPSEASPMRTRSGRMRFATSLAQTPSKHSSWTTPANQSSPAKSRPLSRRYWAAATAKAASAPFMSLVPRP